jgi:hypothetical protein
MKDIDMEIMKLLDEGCKPTTVASLLKITLQEVYDALDNLESGWDFDHTEEEQYCEEYYEQEDY